MYPLLPVGSGPIGAIAKNSIVASVRLRACSRVIQPLTTPIG
ncbi:hypothetical protein NHF48_012375 [Sphingomonas sp. H160509]|nr:hypothetical protein [Sphingomonas sp. H160509]MDD1451587.1 hypothetical protein [Sphingomonas sp. H160509]